ncbi:MAG: CvpA family protein [Alphaproteobacteria bacterium]|nr:CvpA family protein [Alphaproteobacteria bacterium]MDE2494816.1 CvpA family protein [Alphaproteobacteria bacterium]
MSVAFQFLDVVVVAIIIVSTVYATYRGFVSETLSIFAWIAAAFATLYFGPSLAHLMRTMINPAWLGEVVGYGAVFLVVVIPLSFMSYRFSESIKKSQVGALDRALGGAFGVVRGLAIIGIAYLIFSAFVPIPDQPGWIARARLLPLIQGSAEVVASLVPDQHRGGRDHVAEKPYEKTAIHHETARTEPRKAVKPAAQRHVKKTYGAKDRHALDRLIETTDSGKNGTP